MKPIESKCKLYCKDYATCTRENCSRKLMFQGYGDLYMAEEKEYNTQLAYDLKRTRNGVIPIKLNGDNFEYAGVSRGRRR